MVCSELHASLHPRRKTVVLDDRRISRDVAMKLHDERLVDIDVVRYRLDVSRQVAGAQVDNILYRRDAVPDVPERIDQNIVGGQTDGADPVDVNSERAEMADACVVRRKLVGFSVIDAQRIGLRIVDRKVVDLDVGSRKLLYVRVVRRYAVGLRIADRKVVDLDVGSRQARRAYRICDYLSLRFRHNELLKYRQVVDGAVAELYLLRIEVLGRKVAAEIRFADEFGTAAICRLAAQLLVGGKLDERIVNPLALGYQVGRNRAEVGAEPVDAEHDRRRYRAEQRSMDDVRILRVDDVDVHRAEVADLDLAVLDARRLDDDVVIGRDLDVDAVLARQAEPHGRRVRVSLDVVHVAGSKLCIECISRIWTFPALLLERLVYDLANIKREKVLDGRRAELIRVVQRRKRDVGDADLTPIVHSALNAVIDVGDAQRVLVYDARDIGIVMVSRPRLSRELLVEVLDLSLLVVLVHVVDEEPVSSYLVELERRPPVCPDIDLALTFREELGRSDAVFLDDVELDLPVRTSRYLLDKHKLARAVEELLRRDADRYLVAAFCRYVELVLLDRRALRAVRRRAVRSGILCRMLFEFRPVGISGCPTLRKRGIRVIDLRLGLVNKILAWAERCPVDDTVEKNILPVIPDGYGIPAAKVDDLLPRLDGERGIEVEKVRAVDGRRLLPLDYHAHLAVVARLDIRILLGWDDIAEARSGKGLVCAEVIPVLVKRMAVEQRERVRDRVAAHRLRAEIRLERRRAELDQVLAHRDVDLLKRRPIILNVAFDYLSDCTRRRVDRAVVDVRNALTELESPVVGVEHDLLSLVAENAMLGRELAVLEAVEGRQLRILGVDRDAAGYQRTVSIRLEIFYLADDVSGLIGTNLEELVRVSRQEDLVARIIADLVVVLVRRLRLRAIKAEHLIRLDRLLQARILCQVVELDYCLVVGAARYPRDVGVLELMIDDYSVLY